MKWWLGGQRLLQFWKQSNDIHWCHLYLHISHKAVNSVAKHISQSYGELQPAVCLSRGDGAIWRLFEHSWTSDKPQKQATAKAAWATFSTNTCLKCWLMCTAIIWLWKVCLAVVCMEGIFSEIWSHMWLDLQKPSQMAQEVNLLYSLILKLHTSTIQIHQAYGYRWPGLLSQTAFANPVKLWVCTTGSVEPVHSSKKVVCGAKLLPMTV